MNDLTERLDLSEATIYRRVETLERQGLVEEQTLVAEDGNHFSVYWSDFGGTVVTLDDDGYDVRVLREGDIPDGLSRIGEELSSQ